MRSTKRTWSVAATTAMAIWAACGLFAASARAETIQLNSDCTFSADVDCEVGCKDVSFSAMCDVDFQAACGGQCTLDASVSCTGSCETDCLGRCNVQAPSIQCAAYCEEDCMGQCEGYCQTDANRTTCVGECQATCKDSCAGYCNVEPGQVDCTVQCQTACQASCRAEANLDCNVKCSVQARADCEANLEGSCTSSCTSKGGVLICNGEVTTFGSWEDVVAYAEAHGIQVDASGSCTGNSCSGSLSVGQKGGGFCAVTSFAPKSTSSERLAWLGLLALLGLCGIGLRRWRR